MCMYLGFGVFFVFSSNTLVVFCSTALVKINDFVT